MASAVLRVAPPTVRLAIAGGGSLVRQFVNGAKNNKSAKRAGGRSKPKRIAANTRLTLPEILQAIPRLYEYVGRIKELERAVATANLRAEAAANRAAKQLHRYKSCHVPLRRFDDAQARTAEAKEAAQKFSSRMVKLRKLKAELEEAIERRDKNIVRLTEEKKEIKGELRDRDKYIRQNEKLLVRQQRLINECTLNLNKIGRVPCAKCSRCGYPKPLTDFEFRGSIAGKQVEHWLIDSRCSSCQKERRKKVDVVAEKVREKLSVPPVAGSDEDKKDVGDMAAALVARLPGKLVDQVGAGLREEADIAESLE